MSWLQLGDSGSTWLDLDSGHLLDQLRPQDSGFLYHPASQGSSSVQGRTLRVPLLGRLVPIQQPAGSAALFSFVDLDATLPQSRDEGASLARRWLDTYRAECRVQSWFDGTSLRAPRAVVHVATHGRTSKELRFGGSAGPRIEDLLRCRSEGLTLWLFNTCLPDQGVEVALRDVASALGQAHGFHWVLMRVGVNEDRNDTAMLWPLIQGWMSDEGPDALANELIRQGAKTWLVLTGGN